MKFIHRSRGEAPPVATRQVDPARIEFMEDTLVSIMDAFDLSAVARENAAQLRAEAQRGLKVALS